VTIALNCLVGDSVESGLTPGICLVNDNSVDKTFQDLGNGIYTFQYNVSAGDKDWGPGLLPINCEMKSASGHSNVVKHFSDNNTLSGDAHTPRISDYHPEVFLIMGFLVTVLMSHLMAVAAAWVGLPMVTGYLAAGVLAGPYVAGLIPQSEIRSLRFVDELCLGFIALTAGGKLKMETLRLNGASIFLVRFLCVSVLSGTLFNHILPSCLPPAIAFLYLALCLVLDALRLWLLLWLWLWLYR
jgi:hypothetical protein